MDFEKGALFDPGFMQHIQVFSQNVDYAYYTIDRYKNFNQKKNCYKMFFSYINSFMRLFGSVLIPFISTFDSM